MNIALSSRCYLGSGIWIPFRARWSCVRFLQVVDADSAGITITFDGRIFSTTFAMDPALPQLCWKRPSVGILMPSIGIRGRYNTRILS